jgi:hypothetical protein
MKDYYTGADVEALRIDSVVLQESRKYDERDIAELLHARDCSANHTDQCGWTYESWEPTNGVQPWTKTRYLALARWFIQICEMNKISLHAALKLRITKLGDLE